MLEEEKEADFAHLAPNAWIWYAITRMSETLILSIALFPLIALLPLSIPFTIWYGREFIRTFRFRLDGTHLMVRKGVFKRSYTLIPYENIQDVHVVQGFVERMFGIWHIGIFTATASLRGSERILGLRQEEAQRLKSELFRRMREAKHVTD